MPSLVVLADAQSRVGESVTQEMIDSAEALAVSILGPLVGERTETFRLSERRNLQTVDGLWLSRRTDSVTLTNDGDALTEGTDFRLVHGILVEKIPLGESWGDTIVATYEPNDEELVVDGIYNVLTFQSLPANLQSVRIGQYSETYATGTATHPVYTAIFSKVKPSLRLGRYASPFRFHNYREDRTTIEAVPS